MSSYTVSGVVLRRYPLGEADAIVHLLSQERGKVEAVAKGARRTKSSLLAVTQPFVYGKFMLYPGRSLDRLNQGEIISSYRKLREDLDPFAVCTYCCELVDKVLPVGEPAIAVFNLLRELFEYFQTTARESLAIDNALVFFRLKLLSALGYHLDFGHCASCGESSNLGVFSYSEGGPLCRECAGRDPKGVPEGPGIFASLEKLSSLGWAKLGIIKLEPYKNETSKLMDEFYRYHLEVEPRSTEFLNAIRR